MADKALLRALLPCAALLTVVTVVTMALVQDVESALANTPATCAPSRPHAAGTFEETTATSDGLREYRLHVPASYTGSDAVPLVLNFHGFGSNAEDQEAYSQLAVRSDQADGGFIVVSPQGLPGGVGVAHWNNLLAQSPEPDDLAFVNAILDELSAELCIDSQRTFSTGMSNGATMSVRLACSLSSRIAAIAPVAGAYYPPLVAGNATEQCPGARPVPVVAFHGTADATVPFDGGPGFLGIDFRLPIDNDTPDEDVMQSWAAHNGCAGGRQETQITAEVRFISYGSCDGGAVVLLYAVEGGGHTWPGAQDVPALGYTTHDISATDLMWEFFQQHPLDPKPVGGVAVGPQLAPISASSPGGGAGLRWTVAASIAGAVTLTAVLWLARRRRW